MPVAHFFSETYAEARDRFCKAATAAGSVTHSIPIRAQGPENEELTIDIAWNGPSNARSVLLHSSGLHGVEGFAGSAIQLHLLNALPAIPPGVAVVFAHVLNPYGMAWLRRTNEQNVDLNRNFLDEGEAYSGHPEGYAALDPFLNPKRLRVPDLFRLRAAGLILRLGMPALKRATIVGQYDYPEGLFFGGRDLQEGPRRYREFLRSKLAETKQVVAIDVHTGLGPYGEDTLLVAEREYGRLRQVFGRRVQSLSSDRNNVAYPVRGGLHDAVPRLLSRTPVTFVGQEFGTYGPVRVLGVLRKENLAHHHGNRAFPGTEKLALRDAFCPPDPSWKNNVVQRGRDLFEQSLDVLSSG